MCQLYVNRNTTPDFHRVFALFLLGFSPDAVPAGSVIACHALLCERPRFYPCSAGWLLGFQSGFNANVLFGMKAGEDLHLKPRFQEAKCAGSISFQAATFLRPAYPHVFTIG